MIDKEIAVHMERTSERKGGYYIYSERERDKKRKKEQEMRERVLGSNISFGIHLGLNTKGRPLSPAYVHARQSILQIYFCILRSISLSAYTHNQNVTLVYKKKKKR